MKFCSTKKQCLRISLWNSYNVLWLSSFSSTQLFSDPPRPPSTHNYIHSFFLFSSFPLPLLSLPLSLSTYLSPSTTACLARIFSGVGSALECGQLTRSYTHEESWLFFQKLSNASSTSVEDDVIFPLYRLGFHLTWDRSGCCHNYSGLTTAVFCCLKKKKKPLFLEFICSYNHSGHVHEQFQSTERNTEATHTFKLSDKITF